MNDIVISDNEALRAISTFWNQNGCAPALGDLAIELRVSRGKARKVVLALVARELVAQEPRIARSIRLTPEGIEALEGTFPMVPFDDEALADVGGCRVVRYLAPRHVECSPALSAVVTS